MPEPPRTEFSTDESYNERHTFVRSVGETAAAGSGLFETAIADDDLDEASEAETVPPTRRVG